MTTFTFFSAVQSLRSAAALLNKNQEREAWQALDNLMPLVKEGSLTEQQLKLAYGIMLQNADNTSKANALEKLFTTIIPFSAVVSLQSAAAFLMQDKELEAWQALDPFMPLVKEGSITEQQLRLVYGIMLQNTDNRSKARALETLSTNIHSDEARAGRMSAKVMSLLPDSLYRQSIFSFLPLKDLKCTSAVSKDMKQKAANSLGFQIELTGKEIANFLSSKGDIRALVHVKVIKGEGCQDLTDDQIEKISHLPSLERIDLFDNFNISDRALKALGANARKLKSCNVSDTHVTNTGIKALAMGCKELSELLMGYCENIDDNALIALGTYAPNLIKCDAEETNVTSTGVEALAKGCQKLAIINLSACLHIDDRALIALGTYSSQLTSFAATETNVTSTGVKALVIGCMHLLDIYLTKCKNIGDEILTILSNPGSSVTHCIVIETKVTKEAVEAFRKKFPNISVTAGKLTRTPINFDLDDDEDFYV